MADLFALVIGVDCYLPNRLPGGGSYSSLNGPVRDARRVEGFLRDRLGVPSDRLLLLAAARGAAGEPLGSPELLPTYENMAAAFRGVARMASPGDQVYIHYSGHGGRAATVFPGLKGEGGCDEALVPMDIGMPGTQYLRDVEIAWALRRVVDSGLRVTVVLDCCHSGSATRGLAGAVKRGIEEIDGTPRSAESLVAPHPSGAGRVSGIWRDPAGPA